MDENGKNFLLFCKKKSTTVRYNERTSKIVRLVFHEKTRKNG